MTQIHRPARLATRAASFRYGGRHHSGIPGDIIPLYPGDFVGIRTEALLLDLLQHRAVLPEHARDASYAERDELLLRKPLGVLNDALAGREYLVGKSFTVADLNVASILTWGKMARLDMSAHPEAKRWLDGCLARSAYGSVRGRTSRKQ